jgi:hypothetical protein
VTKHNMTSISISSSLYVKALGAYRWLVKIIRNKIIGM